MYDWWGGFEAVIADGLGFEEGFRRRGERVVCGVFAALLGGVSCGGGGG